jgi:hypothetical protein
MPRRLLVAVAAAVLLASCTGSDGDGALPRTTTPLEVATTTTLPSTPVVASILSPEEGSVQGTGGQGMVVVLRFTAKDASVLPAEFRLGGALPGAAVAPGHNPAFPALVVGLSTTPTAMGGPAANLANLFQIVTRAVQADGSAQVTAVWTNPQATFGSDVDATLVAFTVAGTAPDTIPGTQANLDVISNPAEVTFRLSAGGATAAVPIPSTTTSTRPGATTTTRPAATTTTVRPVTVAPTTTAPATTTTVPATTSTTACIPLLGLGCPP